MSYRPEGFEELKRENCVSDDATCDCVSCDSFEAGADAMLEGLKKNEAYLEICGQKITTPKGYLVFIPEGKE